MTTITIYIERRKRFHGDKVVRQLMRLHSNRSTPKPKSFSFECWTLQELCDSSTSNKTIRQPTVRLQTHLLRLRISFPFSPRSYQHHWVMKPITWKRKFCNGSFYTQEAIFTQCSIFFKSRRPALLQATVLWARGLPNYGREEWRTRNCARKTAIKQTEKQKKQGHIITNHLAVAASYIGYLCPM